MAGDKHYRQILSTMTFPRNFINSIFSAGLLSLLLAGCSDDTSSFSSDDRRIKFGVEISSGWVNGSTTRGDTPSCAALPLSGGRDSLYLVPRIIDGIDLSSGSGNTRSSITDTDNIASFGVFASLKPENVSSIENLTPDYMFNVEVTRANSWAPTDEYRWPGSGSLHINAYSPFCSAPTDASEGIVALPSSSSKGELSLSFVTPAEVADQQDLLIASPVEANTSPCDLVFNHALTAIRFATGSEMAPCTVKEIYISGVSSSGTLNMETGAWSDLDSPQTFSVKPETTLSAAAGSDYVVPDTYITSPEQSFLLIPQTLTDAAAISITVDSQGSETTLTTSLDGATWVPGKTIVYRISANPASDSLIFEITDADGEPVSSLQSHYTGSTLNFKVNSLHEYSSGGPRQIPWKAEFIDDEGNVIPQPQWIKDWIMTGEGSEDCVTHTVLQTPDFVSMSSETTTLRNATDINTATGKVAYNLSNPSGDPSVVNTANCYIVRASGKYSLPLVYGNAIKDGAANTRSYTSTSHSTNALKTFINHLGNDITSPYIYENAGCTPADAVLIWEGRLSLISDVTLSDDGKSVVFTVPKDFICQGNALIGVRDSQKRVMWSWQIWFTPYDPDNGLTPVSYSGHTYQLTERNIGQITSGDDAYYAARNIRIRYTQIPDDGSEPKTLTLTLNQDEKHVITPDSYNFFQWGRKDPMISSIKEWYTPDHEEISSTIWTKDFQKDATPGLPLISDYMQNPGYFWTSPTNNPQVFPHTNLWNANLSNTQVVKTIYDPSPAGYCVPLGALMALNNLPITHTNGTLGEGYNVTTSDGNTLFFPAHGDRQSGTGQLVGDGIRASVWTCRPNPSKLASAGALIINNNSTSISLRADEARTEGFGIRPVKE